MRIRRAERRDEAAIRELVFEVLREFGLQPDPEGVDADLFDIEQRYLAPGGVFECLETEEGRILGTAGLFPLRPGVCELRKMYLAPEARGRGWGKLLMERMLAQARERGFRRIELETAECLEQAILLYQRYGFQPMSPDHLASRCDQAFYLDLDTPTP